MVDIQNKRTHIKHEDGTITLIRESTWVNGNNNKITQITKEEGLTVDILKETIKTHIPAEFTVIEDKRKQITAQINKLGKIERTRQYSVFELERAEANKKIQEIIKSLDKFKEEQELEKKFKQLEQFQAQLQQVEQHQKDVKEWQQQLLDATK